LFSGGRGYRENDVVSVELGSQCTASEAFDNVLNGDTRSESVKKAEKLRRDVGCVT